MRWIIYGAEWNLGDYWTAYIMSNDGTKLFWTINPSNSCVWLRQFDDICIQNIPKFHFVPVGPRDGRPLTQLPGFHTTIAGYSALLVASGCIALPFISGTNEGQAIPELTPVSNMIFPGKGSQDSRNMEGFDPGLSSSILRRTVATQCVPLESNMLKKLGGWEEMNKYADTHWSKKGRNVVTNDKHELDYKAELCTAGPVQISYDGTPDCITNNASTAGVFDGTTGTVSIAVLQGFSATSMFTISSSTSIGLTSSFMTMLNFPDITGLMSQFIKGLYQFHDNPE
ncbi:hypothetical protein LENED_010745 [Lentinula edodes]|uniref:Uncharacterized protein n=1 Tax=Lentinula edodes TaxID=5353 RepID=A0A1Q3EN88_LENED|nr:hypothetical protein LENED_010745 [Lentinula edodes]